ncbi:MAG: hypothetical protein HFH57_01670 [Lachnospiraceae bacterium]|nr:hypothetical protein [Lachnospiraceae bacterium]
MKNRVIYLKHKNITTAALMVDECSNILAVKIREQTDFYRIFTARPT